LRSTSHDFNTKHSRTEYYPFGYVLSEYKHPDADLYRFGYQGQFAERDTVTHWNHFELREWDSRLGRWMVPDPYRQFYSPYVGMDNNPVNQLDPDGGFSTDNGEVVGGDCGCPNPPCNDFPKFEEFYKVWDEMGAIVKSLFSLFEEKEVRVNTLKVNVKGTQFVFLGDDLGKVIEDLGGKPNGKNSTVTIDLSEYDPIEQTLQRIYDIMKESDPNFKYVEINEWENKYYFPAQDSVVYYEKKNPFSTNRWSYKSPTTSGEKKPLPVNLTPYWNQ
jgi:RHS repeat-associated protein